MRRLWHQLRLVLMGESHKASQVPGSLVLLKKNIYLLRIIIIWLHPRRAEDSGPGIKHPPQQ